jgi:hypothetical protein
VSATIGIPRGYLLKIWKEMQPASAAGEKAPTAPDADAIKRLETDTIATVQEAVRRLLPERQDSPDIYKPIDVTFYYDVPVEARPLPTFAAQATQWAGDYWQSVVAVVLALFAMMMVRSMVGKAVPAPSHP